MRIKSKLRDFAKGMKLPLKRYAPGDVLIRQGERATDDVFLIKSGAVRIMVSPTDAEGNVCATRPSKWRSANRANLSVRWRLGIS